MTEQPAKKGMSKGCMIGLIITLVLLVMVIAAAVTCYAKKDDLAKFAAKTVIDQTKIMLEEQPVEGIDSEDFNALADSFVVKMDEGELDLEKYGQFFQTIQTMPGDGVIDENEAVELMDAMVQYFPDLQELRDDVTDEGTEADDDEAGHEEGTEDDDDGEEHEGGDDEEEDSVKVY